MNQHPSPSDPTLNQPLSSNQVTNQPTTAQSPTPEQEKSHKQLIRILILVIVVPFFVIILVLVILVLTSLNSARGKAKDTQIKSSIQQLLPQAYVYDDEHGTFKGWGGDPEAASSIKSLGSELIISSTDNNFIIYARLPHSGNYFCIDSTGFGDEVNSISSTQTACE